MSTTRCSGRQTSDLQAALRLDRSGKRETNGNHSQFCDEVCELVPSSLDEWVCGTIIHSEVWLHLITICLINFKMMLQPRHRTHRALSYCLRRFFHKVIVEDTISSRLRRQKYSFPHTAPTLAEDADSTAQVSESQSYHLPILKDCTGRNSLEALKLV